MTPVKISFKNDFERGLELDFFCRLIKEMKKMEIKRGTRDFTYDRAPEVEDMLLRNFARIINGEVTLPPIRYNRTEGIHLSDLEGCMYQSFYNFKVDQSDFQINRDSVLRFLRGRAFERFAIPIPAPEKVHDGIICTVDALFEPEESPGTQRILELKCTASGSSGWTPEEQTSWLRRLAGYCKAYNQQTAYLAVLFISGNTQNFTTWAIKQNGRPRDKFSSIDLFAWKVVFYEEYIAKVWSSFLRKASSLKNAISMDSPDVIKADGFGNQFQWMCNGCKYSGGFCEYEVKK